MDRLGAASIAGNAEIYIIARSSSVQRSVNVSFRSQWKSRRDDFLVSGPISKLPSSLGPSPSPPSCGKLKFERFAVTRNNS